MPPGIYALLLVNFAVGTQGFVFGGVLAELAADLGVTTGTAGLAITASAVTFAVGSPVFAVLFGRAERRTVLLAGLAVLLLGNIGCALAPNFAALFALRVLTGLGAGLVGAVGGATAAQIAPPEKRGQALALVLGGLTLAFTLGLPLGSAAGGAFGWRACFVLSIVLTLGAIAALLLVLPRVQPMPGPRPSPTALLAIPAVRSAFATNFLAFAGSFCVVAFTGPLVNAVTGYAGAAVGPFQACIGVGSLLGLALGGKAADGSAARRVLPISLLVLAACLLGFAALIAGWARGWAVPLLGLAILVNSATLFAMVPVLQNRLAAVAGAATPLAFALNGSLVSLGQGAGAAIGGGVKDSVGFAGAGLVGAAVVLAALLASRRVFAAPAPAPVPKPA
ncbi:MFS transporter [Roseomonas sp. CCTCC AB2023176]|uniref:MFS transporter n=1 Tax=Roseomonas sp. CCTCC AB2023176 TaxID=3342640 RepID=UPI0035D8D9BA